MNKKIAGILSVLVILVFIGYMVFDTSKSEGPDTSSTTIENTIYPDGNWKIADEFSVKEGSLKAVTASRSGNIYLGGDSFVSCYSSELNQLWTLTAPAPVTSLAYFGDTIYATTMDMVLVINDEGKLLNEWGPFENNSIITSVSANKSYVAFADAGNKTLFMLDKGGEVKRMIGRNDGQFIVPSAYFDVALDSAGFIYVANTGHRRLETRGSDGATISYFGEPGTAPDAFCGCCNPAHFIKTKTGYITAEKGINRIKILGESGEFIEFVSSKNDFTPSVPLDIASIDGNTIYAANPFDSKLYVFKRKGPPAP
jgi:hypothetical protein